MARGNGPKVIERICELASGAGKDGLRAVDLHERIGLAKSNATWYLQRMCAAGQLVKAESRAPQLTRYFSPSFRADAQAYSAKVNADAAGAVYVSHAAESRILQAIEGAGKDGIGIDGIALAVRLAKSTVYEVMPTIVKRHALVVGRDWSRGNGAKLYLAAGLVAPAKVEAAVRRKTDDATEAQKASGFGDSKAPGASSKVWNSSGLNEDRAPRKHQGFAPVFSASTKRTACPSFEDRRFRVDRPTPFFSAMTPGSYLKTGSALEAAYLERIPAGVHVVEAA